ncbi:MAG: hypothetical protein AAFX50_01145, partial [Acidobacteriota bacterium]
GFERVERGAASRSVVPTEPVRARTHEVKAGESLFRIAERYYGNGHLWRKLAEKHGTSDADFRDWVIVNNGFVDLRPHALASAAKEPGPDLGERVGRFEEEAELIAWLGGLESGSYFTTAGLVALLHRLRRLGKAVTSRKVQLGTRETWKHLFRQDRHGRHLLSPGLIETARMYNEGLGKITGTEALWPPWGY